MKTRIEQPKLDIKKNLKFIWFYLKKYKAKSVIILISSFLSTSLLSAAIFGQFYFTEYISKSWVSVDPDGGIPIPGAGPIWGTILVYSSLIITSYIIFFLLSVLQVFIMTKLAQTIGKQIRKDLFHKTLELKLSYFDSHPSGDIMSKLTNDVNNITNALTQNVTQFLTSTLQILFMLISMFIFSPILAVIVLCIAPFQFSFIFFILKKAQPNFLKKQVYIGELNGFVEETISGQKVINNFNKKNETIKDFTVINERIRVIDRKTSFLSGVVNPWNTLISSGTTVLIISMAFVFSSNNFEFGLINSTIGPNGKTNPATAFSLVLAFTMLLRSYTNPTFQIFQLLNVIQTALAGTERAFSIFSQEEEIKDYETIEVSGLKGDVVIKNLTFSYDGRRDVLKNISFHAKPGEVVGIVGPTGSGKTTIINLLTKFYDIEHGDITIDGISIKNITKNSLRNEVSIVLQDTFIFGESIYENIRRACSTATNEEIEDAAKMANAEHFILLLKDGYNTVIENNADELSQGQRQLLAIARAILKKSNILILDEATSSIDTKTEKDIQDAMIKLSKDKTTFVIAHRLSTIRNADQIIVLKEGEIIELGNHKSLIDKKGFYYNLYNSGINTPEDI
ncbi:MAG: ABC transporter ATP-binding protein [Mycoplasmataceae bacterium]|nr:ABC transporter ATP-binding protein [Mycoplasmataceae bacterium]